MDRLVEVRELQQQRSQLEREWDRLQRDRAVLVDTYFDPFRQIPEQERARLRAKRDELRAEMNTWFNRLQEMNQQWDEIGATEILQTLPDAERIPRF